MDIIIILVIIGLILILYINNLQNIIKNLKFKKQSQSVNYGKITEQFFPFNSNYPYNTQNFRFLGSPIDGIQFEDDKIIILDFKFNTSRLNEKQKNIKKLISEKKVFFETFQLK